MEHLRLSLIILLVTSTTFGDRLYDRFGRSCKADDNVNVIVRREKTVARDQAEELDIAQIKKKAKSDARLDSDLESNVFWCGTSFILSSSGILLRNSLSGGIRDAVNFGIVAGLVGLPLAAFLKKVNLPENREKDLSSESREYQTIYRSEYSSQIKRQRLKYSLVGPAIIGAILGYRMMWRLAGLSEELDSEDGDSKDD